MSPLNLNSRAGRPLRFASLATAGLLALTAPAFAQQKKAPAPAPAQQQPAPAPAPAPDGPAKVVVKPEPSQTDWLKVCGTDPGNNKQICYTTRDFVAENGEPVLAVAVYAVQDDPERIVRFLLPLGFLLEPGVRFNLESGQPVAGKFAICFPNGCFAEAKVRDDFIKNLKAGNNLAISIRNQAGREVAFQVPLAGFGKAFDGAPIDPKVLEEQQKKLQEELQKRGEALRQQQQQQGGAPAAAAPGAPAPKP